MVLPVVNRAVCRCGECGVETYSDPFVTVNCHCSHCREMLKNYPEEFETVSLFWSPAAKPHGPIHYYKTSALMGLVSVARGRCSKCQSVLCGYGLRMYTGIFFVRELSPVHPRKPGVKDPLQPIANIFYESGLKQGELGMPITIHSDWASFLYCTWIILSKGAPQLVGFAFRWLWNASSEVDVHKGD